MRATGNRGRAVAQWSLLAAIAIIYGTGAAGAEKPPSDKGDRVVTGGDLAFMNDAAPGGMSEVAPTLEHHLQMIRALAKDMHLQTK